jgi:hypothetical protein
MTGGLHYGSGQSPPSERQKVLRRWGGIFAKESKADSARFFGFVLDAHAPAKLLLTKMIYKNDEAEGAPGTHPPLTVYSSAS